MRKGDLHNHSTDERPLDLVFHGGSGSDKEQIAEALTYGVFKMNIDTDTQFVYSKAIGSYVEENHKAFKYQIDPEDGALSRMPNPNYKK